jgi:hypothetical protein
MSSSTSQILPCIHFPDADLFVRTMKMTPTTTQDPRYTSHFCLPSICHMRDLPAYAPAPSNPPVDRTAPAIGGPSRIAKLMKVSWKPIRAPAL